MGSYTSLPSQSLPVLSALIGRSCKGEKQQLSLVNVELRVADKHPTGDVREARTEMKHSQSPCFIFPAGREQTESAAGVRAAEEMCDVKHELKTRVKKERKGEAQE